MSAGKEKEKKTDLQLTRHISMIEKFEQHFPHYQFVSGRFILYSDSTAQIENSEKNNPVFSLSQGPKDYEKLQAQVKIYSDSPSIPMQIKVFKYLSRVF